MISTVQREAATDPAWAPAVRGWGIATALFLLVGAVGYFVEANGFLGAAPTYEPTSAGQLHDEAAYWVATFAYRNATLWDYLLRDGAFLLGFLGFIPIVLAANVATGGGRAAIQIAAGFFVAGGLFGALNAIVYLVNVSWWRTGGWDRVPPEIMSAIGRSTEFMSDLSAWCGIASGAAFVLALAYLGRACQTESRLPRRMAALAFAGAAFEAVLVVVLVADPAETATLRTILGVLTGIGVAPLIAAWLGVHLGRVLATGMDPSS